MRYYKSETINGVANQTVYGKGLTSTEAEKITLVNIYFITSARQGNYAEVWKEKERLAEINDNAIPLPADNPKQAFEMDIDIPVGQTVNVALRCGGSATDLTVIYEYEISG